MATDDLTTRPVAAPGGGAALLRRYIARLNHGVRSGDFTSMLAELTVDAELVFEGIPVGPFRGREVIGAAYRLQPPDDELDLLHVETDRTGGTTLDKSPLAGPSRRRTVAPESRHPVPVGPAPLSTPLGQPPAATTRRSRGPGRPGVRVT
jgi:hypothetical protein